MDYSIKLFYSIENKIDWIRCKEGIYKNLIEKRFLFCDDIKFIVTYW